MARPRKNNADYFSHDNNMRNHRKIKALRNKFGLEGYAVFNMFLETLTECDQFKLCIKKELDWELLSADFGINSERLQEIIQYCKSIELLLEENNCFFSDSLLERLEPVLVLRGQKRDWANKRWNNESETELKNTKTELSNTKTMQSKVNKSKVNISKDIELSYSEPLRETFNTKAKTFEKLGIPYTPTKKSSKQEKYFERCKLVDYFKEAVNQEHGKSYFTHPDDVKDVLKENSKITAQMKIFVERGGGIEKAKEIIIWFANGYGEWCEYKPSGCFRKETIIDFENKKVKPTQKYYE